MLKLIVAIFVAGGIAHGCHDSLKGSLTLDETLSVRTSKGLTDLQPGNYQLTVKMQRDRIVLNLKGAGRQGLKVRLTLDRPPKTPDKNGDLALLASQSGQPFDLVGHVTSMSAGGSVPANGPSRSSRPCAPVRSYPLVDDGSQQLEVRQYPTVSSIHGTEHSMLTAAILDPLTGRALGRFSASLTKGVASSFNSGC